MDFKAQNSKNKNSYSDQESEAFIFLVSNNKLQNELLLPFLSSKTGLEVECVPDFETGCLCNENNSLSKNIVLVDFEGIDTKDIWNRLTTLKDSEQSHLFFALYNVSTKDQIEKKAMENGVKGIFYNSDSPEIIPKGINTILKGDLWYSRKILTKCLLDNMIPENDKTKITGEQLLTQREKEVLEMIALGLNSKQISDELSISAHTVKTHIYNVYNKINVNNRLQATLWAAKFL